VQLTIKNLTPRDVQMFMVLWGRLKGSGVSTEDFKYIPDPQDYVVCEVNKKTQGITQTQYTSIPCPCCGGKTVFAAPIGDIPDTANFFCTSCWGTDSKQKTQETQQ
jgi:hypothetical protein